MLPPLLEVESDGGMVSKGRQGVFGSLIYGFILFARCAKLSDFLGDHAFKIYDVEVRILGVSDGCIVVVFSPG